MSVWLNSDLRPRVRARAASLGKTLTAVYAEAKVSDRWLAMPARGRNIGKLEDLASALEWSLAELLGFAELPDADILKTALMVAEDFVGLNAKAGRERIAAIADLAANAYPLLRDLRARGMAIDNEEVVRLVVAGMRLAPPGR